MKVIVQLKKKTGNGIPKKALQLLRESVAIVEAKFDNKFVLKSPVD